MIQCLADYARQELEFNAKQDDKGTKREHLESAQRQGGKVLDEIELVECPIEVLYLWEWYLEISTGRSYGAMGGPLPISSMEIKAWCDLKRTTLEQWELEAIRMMDHTERALRHEEYKNKTQ